MMRHRSFAIALVQLTLPLLAGTSAYACGADAVALFACEAAKGKKYIELCAPSPVDAKDGFLEYRFGTIDKNGADQPAELVFPPSRPGSLKRFYGATYSKGASTRSRSGS